MLVATVFNFRSIPGDLKVSQYSQTLEIFWPVCMGPWFGSAWSRMHGLSWKTPLVQVNNCDIFSNSHETGVMDQMFSYGA